MQHIYHMDYNCNTNINTHTDRLKWIVFSSGINYKVFIPVLDLDLFIYHNNFSNPYENTTYNDYEQLLKYLTR